MQFPSAFSALKNPVLRRTVAKVTTLRQAAKVGNVELTDMINRLREEVGQNLLQVIAIELQSMQLQCY